MDLDKDMVQFLGAPWKCPIEASDDGQKSEDYLTESESVKEEIIRKSEIYLLTIWYPQICFVKLAYICELTNSVIIIKLVSKSQLKLCNHINPLHSQAKWHALV